MQHLSNKNSYMSCEDTTSWFLELSLWKQTQKPATTVQFSLPAYNYQNVRPNSPKIDITLHLQKVDIGAHFHGMKWCKDHFSAALRTISVTNRSKHWFLVHIKQKLDWNQAQYMMLYNPLLIVPARTHHQNYLGKKDGKVKEWSWFPSMPPQQSESHGVFPNSSDAHRTNLYA
jgi:hypothetical protein